MNFPIKAKLTITVLCMTGVLALVLFETKRSSSASLLLGFIGWCSEHEDCSMRSTLLSHFPVFLTVHGSS